MAEKKLSIVLELVDKASAQLAKVSKSFDGVGKSMNAAAGASKALAAGIAVGVAAVAAGAVKSINLAREQIKVEKQLDAVIKSTGGAAGLTAEEIKTMASELQKMSNFGDEAIIAGQNMLLTFTNIGEDVFPAATQTMLDMSAALGTDLAGQAVQLGKALNDPIAGIGALSKVGVSFTDTQKDMIKTMVDAGDTAGAQTLILEELAKEFGGSAEAQIDPIIQLQNAVGDIGEEIGKLLLEKINPIVEGLLAWMDQMGGLQGIIEAAKTWLEEHQAIIFIVAGAIMGALVPALIAGAIAGWAFIAPLIPFIVIGALVAATIFVIWQGFKALADLLPMVTAAWELMKTAIKEKMDKMKADFTMWWDGVKAKFTEGLEAIKVAWETAWQFILDNAIFIMAALLAVSTGGMSLIIAWFIKNREKIVGALGGLWDSVKQKAIDAFEGIKVALRGSMQFILAKVNKFIGGLNKALAVVPGVSFQLPTLPAFAEGGIVTKPTVGLIGEAGAEAVIPLSKAGQFGLGGGGGTTIINITVEGEGEELVEKIARKLSDLIDREGRTSIAMGNS